MQSRRDNETLTWILDKPEYLQKMAGVINKSQFLYKMFFTYDYEYNWE